MTYHVSKFCPLSGQFAANRCRSPTSDQLRNRRLSPLTMKRLWECRAKDEVSTHDQKARTFFRPGNPNRVWEEATERCASSQARFSFLQARLRGPDSSAEFFPHHEAFFSTLRDRVAPGVDFRWNRADISTDRAGNCHNGSLRSVYGRDRPET